MKKRPMKKSSVWPAHLASLARGFTLTELNAATWRVECRACCVAFGLKKDSQHPGNVLTLLNHEAGHNAGGAS